MCYKCLTVALIIITWILFFIFAPSEYWASWLTAISTFAMAIIAWRALNAWKKEVREKKVFEINKKYIEAINKFESLMNNYELISEEEETRKILKSIYKNFNEVLYEYNLVQKKTNKETEFLRNLLFFKLTIDQYITQKFESKDRHIRFYFDNFWDDYTPSQDEEGEIIETEEYKVLSEKLKKAKELCENNINKFYN